MGESSGDSTQLLYLRARYYDPSLGRFLTQDTWEGNYSIPLSLNQWDYANSDPINYSDPSGHCSGDPNDVNNPDQKCWNLIQDIQNVYHSFKILDQDKWTYEELYVLRHATSSHIFAQDILSANEIRLYRKHVYTVVNEAGIAIEFGSVAGATHPVVMGEYELTMYDYAYHAAPDNNVKWSPYSLKNFEGTIIHELTHIAMLKNPNILKSYKEEKAKHKYSGSNIGNKYDWEACSKNPACDPDAERLAITASAWQLSRKSFDSLFNTDWRKAWIRSQYSSSLLVGVCYEPLP